MFDIQSKYKKLILTDISKTGPASGRMRVRLVTRRSRVRSRVRHILSWERGGSVVECRTPEREVRGSRPTAAVLCP